MGKGIFFVLAILAVGTTSHAQVSGFSGDVDQAIADYLGGEGDIAEKFKQAVEAYKGPSCTLSGTYNGIAIRQFHDLLVRVGDVLCALKVTCFTKYVKDFFPVPSSSGEVLGATQSAQNALYMGRWYQLYEPLTLLLTHYEGEKRQKGTKDPETPKVLLVYPDLKVGDREGFAEVGRKPEFLGDADMLGELKVGNLVSHLRYPHSSFDKLNTQGAGALEYLSALAGEAFPGIMLFVPDRSSSSFSSPRLFLIVGSTAQGIPKEILPLECQPSAQNPSMGTNYLEMAGKVPQFWADIVGGVLPMAQSLLEFIQGMEEQENSLKGVEGGNR